MKILSFLGALFVLVAVAAGTSSVLGAHPANAHSLTASALGVIPTPYPAIWGIPTPSANPTPTPRPKAAAPAPRKAAPPAKAAAPVRHPAAPAIVVRTTQQALINQDRARYGLRPLSWSSCLSAIAYSNAYRMARQGYISHTDGPTRDLGCHLGSRAGENVGWWSRGVNDDQINTMFMNSPDHRANILGPYHYVATAWVTAPNFL